MAVVALTALQVRHYLLVPPEKLVRTNGGVQWIVNRELGRELARRTQSWERPTLFLWGWQGPLYFYSGLPQATRQVFTDDFLKNFAETSHPEARPRIERTMADLEASPPSIIFAGYPPFPALRELLLKRYLPSRLVPNSGQGMGLWIERSKFGDFETYTPPAGAGNAAR